MILLLLFSKEFSAVTAGFAAEFRSDRYRGL
jgi:hypothetical protein